MRRAARVRRVVAERLGQQGAKAALRAMSLPPQARWRVRAAVEDEVELKVDRGGWGVPAPRGEARWHRARPAVGRPKRVQPARVVANAPAVRGVALR